MKTALALLLSACTLGAANVGTGTHWPDIADFPTLKNLGYDFAVTNVNPANRAEWAPTFDAAGAAGLKLVIGMYPVPYRLTNGVWSITPAGQEFLRYAASRAASVKAIFVYNEPYWVNPFTNKNDLCGALSAQQLRDLRSAIRTIWPDAKIYHDIGTPGAWAPSGSHWKDYPCVANKYADATGVADFVGIWYYPFTDSGYQRTEGLATLRQEIAYVRAKMLAEPVLVNQAFTCKSCKLSNWPTADQLKDWHCATRSLGAEAISWYAWRQDLYDGDLFHRPQLWPSTSPSVCANNGAGLRVDTIRLASSPALLTTAFAPGSLVSLFGNGLAESTLAAAPGALPVKLATTTVMVNDIPAPLLFVSPGQINLQFPFELAGPQASVTVRVAGTPSIAVSAPLVESSPSIFTLTGSGEGPGAIVKLNGSLVSRGNPVQPREFVSIYATGLGPVSPVVASGAVSPGPLALAWVAAPVTASVDGRFAAVTFAGLSPWFTGLYQINVQMPAALSTSYPRISVAVNGIASPEVSAGGPGLLGASPAEIPVGMDAAVVLRGINLAPGSVLEVAGEKLSGRILPGDPDQFQVLIPKRLLAAAGMLLLAVSSLDGAFTVRSNAVSLKVGGQL